MSKDQGWQGMSGFLRTIKPLIEKSPFLASLYRHWRDERELHRQPSSHQLGFQFVGNPLMESGQFEPVETALIGRLMAHVPAVINIGANIGYYCCLALQQGKPVVAFEPMPTNQRYLLRNVVSNGWGDQFECFPMALSSSKGVIEIFGGGTGASLVKGWAGQHFSTLVPMSTLDSVLGARFENEGPLVIVDIEGAEFGMLQGASLLLKAQVKPIWFVEISVAEHQPEGVDVNPHLLATFEQFWQCGYEALTAEPQSRRVSREEVTRIEATGVDTLGVHNFVFVDPARSTVLFPSLA
ncbi:FkbM family methyltransferase [Curvibacter sp. HBC28]|uniref:FkbM family methyltransferase n=1 Tax=Curvibacter microcysteis TaxID=3026419 RepID=A0ABT5MJ15_9BURK|nr:FkbM family methyltransferase [Curvibacter sp. HBC28]MDD0815131.1 FkbM family methyltransferase [Curvibacter sp. HBC28]